MPNDLVNIALRLLSATDDDVIVLKIYELAEDYEMHDDAIQSQLLAKFVIAFEEAVGKLTTHFGHPFRSGTDEDDTIPITGVSNMRSGNAILGSCTSPRLMKIEKLRFF